MNCFRILLLLTLSINVLEALKINYGFKTKHDIEMEKISISIPCMDNVQTILYCPKHCCDKTQCDKKCCITVEKDD